MQAVLKLCKPGPCLIDLLKWWLNHDARPPPAKASPQHSLKPRKSPRLLSDLLRYLHDTVLNPEYAVPEDLSYFGSPCFSLCMKRFEARVYEIARETEVGEVF